MGAFFTNLWWAGNPDIADPETGLSRRDIYHVQSSWALVYKDRVSTGSQLFVRLFTAYPENKAHFKSFKNTPNENLPNKAQFRAHVVNVMSSLNMMIEHLDQPNIFSVMVEKLGETHASRRIQRHNFDELKEIIVQLLIDTLKLDEASLKSWDRAVTYLYKILYPKLEE